MYSAHTSFRSAVVDEQAPALVQAKERSQAALSPDEDHPVISSAAAFAAIAQTFLNSFIQSTRKDLGAASSLIMQDVPALPLPPPISLGGKVPRRCPVEVWYALGGRAGGSVLCERPHTSFFYFIFPRGNLG